MLVVDGVNRALADLAGVAQAAVVVAVARQHLVVCAHYGQAAAGVPVVFALAPAFGLAAGGVVGGGGGG